MKFLVQIARFLVGSTFIFSGLVKLNDPMGLAFKLHDYFAPGVLNLGFLDPFTVPLALGLVVLEIVLGVALLLGFQPRLTVYSLAGLIAFFTFLTFYSAYFNKVTDCGCFGDAIPLTPWESFYKDVILSVLILVLAFGLRHIKPILTGAAPGSLSLLSGFISICIGLYVILYQPFIDFRPYAVGKSIPEGMKTAVELGLEPTRYATLYTLVNSSTGATERVDSERYNAERWWEKKEWVIDESKTESIVVQEGYEPPVHDFVIGYAGQDLTQAVLEAEALLLVPMRSYADANKKGLGRIDALSEFAKQNGILMLGVAPDAPAPEELAETLHFNVGTADLTTIKTMTRSNPGLMLLRRGTVAGKWAHRALPEPEELKALL
ncbi:DoxX family membrane protein [bacterium]|nr:DoxX family membrane protein [bacterium]